MGRAKIDNKSRQPSNTPVGYQIIRIHLAFAVKHDGCHKALLVDINRGLPHSTLLGVSWQMCHAWITPKIVIRVVLMIVET